jgi:hypothetical protein
MRMSLFSLLLFLTLFAGEPLPHFIQFAGKKGLLWKEYAEPHFAKAAKAFNHAPEFSPFFNYLKQTYQIERVIETGTYQGNTTELFALLFDHVDTIEIIPSSYQESKEKLSVFPHVECHLGSSEAVLRNILPSLQGIKCLFYLDAHWEGYWPLLEEIAEIAKTHRDNCILVIDDIKVPGAKKIPYDSYGAHECSYEYVKKQLDQTYSGYTVHYLIPKHFLSRAKMVVIPTAWQN